jgi:nitrogen fixation NifU-like protein
MYNEKVMDHFMNPRNVGEIPDASGVGEVGNVSCGDIMKIYLLIDENEVIEDIKFKTFGCGSAIASSSIATTMLKGKKVTDALKLTNKEVLDELGGLPAVKIHCSVLAEQAIKAAVLDYAKKNGKHYDELDSFDPDDDGHHHDDLVQLEF